MASSVLGLFDQILAVDRQTIAAATSLYAGYPQLSARDVLHVATCRRNGIDRIVSVESGFDTITELRWVLPAAAADGG